MIRQLANFDTHAVIKHLHAAGLDDKVAEAIVDSIAMSKKSDLSNLVSKQDFFDFKSEVDDRFNTIDQEITNIKNTIEVFRKETQYNIDALRKDTKSDMDALRKDTKSDMDALRKDTKSDMDALRKDTKSDMDALRKDTKSDMDAFRKDTKSDMDALRKDVATQIANSKNEMIKWFVGLFLTQVVSVIALLITIIIKSHI